MSSLDRFNPLPKFRYCMLSKPVAVPILRIRCPVAHCTLLHSSPSIRIGPAVAILSEAICGWMPPFQHQQHVLPTWQALTLRF